MQDKSGFAKTEADVRREQQFPGSKFGSGNTTLYSIVQSGGTILGSPDPGTGAVASERDAKILANAVPAHAMEAAIQSLAKQQPRSESQSPQRDGRSRKPVHRGLNIVRGMMLRHKPTGKKVVVIEASCDTTDRGKIRHLVCIAGKKDKFKVTERNLEAL